MVNEGDASSSRQGCGFDDPGTSELPVGGYMERERGREGERERERERERE